MNRLMNMEMTDKKIDNLIDQLVTKDNELKVRKISVELLNGSLGNPKISVGTLPFYDFSSDKKITYVITGGRYLDCNMLCYNKYKGDKDFQVTKSYKQAREIVRKIILSYIEQTKK